MKKYIYPVILFLLMLTACKDLPVQTYYYEKNPVFTWGYYSFYGDYYNDYGIEKNIFSVSLFSETLDVNEKGQLVGYGQYLYLEDIFLESAELNLAEGSYRTSKDIESFVFAPGEYYIKGDKKSKLTGSFIYYFESDDNKSVRKPITQGVFTVSKIDGNYSIVCTLTVEDEEIEIHGKFDNKILHRFDESQQRAKNRQFLPLILHSKQETSTASAELSF